jgi:hypothetical protein
MIGYEPQNDYQTIYVAATLTFILFGIWVKNRWG